MKILIVMGGYFPGEKYGGPPVSVDNFCSLMKEHDCYIVTVNHDLFEKKPYSGIQPGWNDRVNSKILYVADNEYNKKTFCSVINELQPDVIYLQGLFQSCILPCLQLAQKFNLRVLLAPRGELCKGAIELKRYKKIPYICMLKMFGLLENVHFQSTSHEETEAIKKWLNVEDSRIHFLNNIPSIPRKEYDRPVKKRGEARFIFLSRIHPKKNLLFAISLFKHIDGKVNFDIYGPIEDETYWKECEAEIEKLPENVTVEYCGLVSHDKVHKIFSKYDVFLFPTLSENYGHVIAESLSVGTPVIISDQTPWSDVNQAGIGFAYSLRDKDLFVKAVQTMVDSDSIDENAVKQFLNKRLNLEKLKEDYEGIFRNI